MNEPITPEQVRKLLNAIFDTPDGEPEDDNYPDTDHEKVGYSEYVLTHSLQYIGKAIHRLSRLDRLMALPELPDIIKHNELRMALEPLLQVENDIKDITEMLTEVYRDTKIVAQSGEGSGMDRVCANCSHGGSCGDYDDMAIGLACWESSEGEPERSDT